MPEDVSNRSEREQRVEATGYSDSFSLDEAIHDAISKLPPDDNDFPDKMLIVRVDSINAEIGGIANLDRMVVRISTSYKSLPE